MPGPDPVSASAATEKRFGGRLLDASEATQIEVRGATQSAVLVSLAERDREPWTVFTRRRADLRRHAGEISFPGGRREAEDADLIHTALREAQEEIGLDPAAVTVIGALAPTPTIATGYAIYPVVGVIPDGLAWLPSPDEVAELIELPLRAVRAGYERRRLTRRGMPIRTDTYVVGEHLIWGATARILGDLFERIEL